MKNLKAMLMTKLRFSFHGLVKVEATILVTGFPASRDFFLRPSSGFVYMNVRLNLSEFPLGKNVNNSKKVTKLFVSPIFSSRKRMNNSDFSILFLISK